MLRKLRQKLAMIRYYSAPQRQTRWTRARDIAFFTSFFLCLPATWIANHTVIRPTTAIDVSGWLGEKPGPGGQTIPDAAMANNARSYSAGSNVKVTGNFRLVIEDDYHGWPLTTSVYRPPARLSMDLFAEPLARANVRLEPDSPQRRAIENALTEDGQIEALNHWQRDGVEVRQQWLNWFIAAGVWWILMVFASSFVINLARFAWLFGHRSQLKKKAAWRAEGKCHACGYDLTGLEFNERCPECGQLVM